MKNLQKTWHLKISPKTNEISTTWRPRTHPSIAPDLQNHTKGPPGRSQDIPRAPRMPMDLPRDTQRTPRFLQGPPKHPQGPTSIPKTRQQHFADSRNLCKAPQNHAPSIPQISAKKPVCLKDIYRFLTLITSVFWVLVASSAHLWSPKSV